MLETATSGWVQAAGSKRPGGLQIDAHRLVHVPSHPIGRSHLGPALPTTALACSLPATAARKQFA